MTAEKVTRITDCQIVSATIPTGNESTCRTETEAQIHFIVSQLATAGELYFRLDKPGEAACYRSASE